MRGFLSVLTRKILVDKKGKEILIMYSNLEACRGVYTVFSVSRFILYTLVINVLMLPGIYKL